MATLTELNWRPIKDAPRDGSEILARLSNGWMVLIRYPVGWERYAWWKSDNISVSIPVEETHGGIKFLPNRLRAVDFIDCKDLNELPKINDDVVIAPED